MKNARPTDVKASAQSSANSHTSSVTGARKFLDLAKIGTGPGSWFSACIEEDVVALDDQVPA